MNQSKKQKKVIRSGPRGGVEKVWALMEDDTLDSYWYGPDVASGYYQCPVFNTKKDATYWRKKNRWLKMKIVPATITFKSPTK